mgnify:FL=1
MATDRQVAHYSALAKQAQTLAAVPRPGCETVLLPWGKSEAFVEVEDCEDHGPVAHRVCLNGVWVEVYGNVPEDIVDGWLQRLRNLRTLSIAANRHAARWAA